MQMSPVPGLKSEYLSSHIPIAIWPEYVPRVWWKGLMRTEIGSWIIPIIPDKMELEIEFYQISGWNNRNTPEFFIQEVDFIRKVFILDIYEF